MRGLDGFQPTAPDKKNPFGMTRVTSTNKSLDEIDRSDAPVPVPIGNRPAAPLLTSPSHDTHLSETTDVTLQWNVVKFASQYLLQYQGGPIGVVTTPWVNDTFYYAGRLPPGNYSWRVQARDTLGRISDWSETRALAIDSPTQPPAPPPPVITITPTPTAPAIVLPPSPIITITPPPLVAQPPPAPASPGRLVLMEGLAVSNSNPQTNQSVNGRYRVRNDGGQAITLRYLGIKGRHSTGANYDFFWVENLTLQPGQEYAYDANRPFDRTGMYLLTPNLHDGKDWSDIRWRDGSANYVSINVVSAPPPPAIITPSPTPRIITPTPTAPPPPGPTGNLAPHARREPDGPGSGNAFDGNQSTFWREGLGHRFNLRLTLAETATVKNRIIVWDRPQNSPDNQQINQLILSLSNGWSKRFDMQSGGPRCVDVTLSSPQRIAWVNLKADDASGHNGLSEVEIWAGNKTSGPSCSNKGTLP